jgi:hypothetical protein
LAGYIRQLITAFSFLFDPEYTFTWVFVQDLAVSGPSSCLSIVLVISPTNLQDRKNKPQIALLVAVPSPNPRQLFNLSVSCSD